MIDFEFNLGLWKKDYLFYGNFDKLRNIMDFFKDIFTYLLSDFVILVIVYSIYLCISNFNYKLLIGSITIKRVVPQRG